ncbi:MULTISPECIES: hypothetical protein [Caballeronia]|uniref:Uncharacterized protein n=1 Tax=Caballeronia concitans TaxID=1777133 RepID=A0A658QW11_9BURK|nr:MULTISPECIES: hypothetical protein [Caballeronia]KIG03709.1 hypothetical protein BurMR1_4671 [Burkholderia sp. MR1]SAL27755.1 hypothetical protein AWB72_02218 [Caballeronia concitans]
MSSIIVRDLSHSKDLDRRAMSAVSGGQGYGPYANVEVNVGILQNLTQVQKVDVTALSNIGYVGAGVSPHFDISPVQIGKLNASAFL